MKKINTVSIYGKRWFQKTCGNTYHCVTVIVNDEVQLFRGFTYGYGNHYLLTAAELLIENGYSDMKPYDLESWLARNAKYNAIDVKRKKDLTEGIFF